MMAEYLNHPTNGDGVTIAAPDLSLLTAALPSVLRERLASFRKTMLLGELGGVHPVPKLPGDCAYASELPMGRDLVGDKQGQVGLVEDELSRPSSSSSSCSVTPGTRTPGDHAGAITKIANDSGVAWNRVSPGMCMALFIHLQFQLLNFSPIFRFQSPSECDFRSTTKPAGQWTCAIFVH